MTPPVPPSVRLTGWVVIVGGLVAVVTVSVATALGVDPPLLETTTS